MYITMITDEIPTFVNAPADAELIAKIAYEAHRRKQSVPECVASVLRNYFQHHPLPGIPSPQPNETPKP